LVVQFLYTGRGQFLDSLLQMLRCEVCVGGNSF
jgi:hypothetical protein